MKNTALFSISFFEFFIELTLNNHKTWFDVNRKRYEKEVKGVFENFVSALIERFELESEDFKGLVAKECIFRINRDVRFSKDKNPYKLFCSASIHKGGKKSMIPGGLYIEIGPEKCAIYSGVYMPEKDDLLSIRENIANNLDAFKVVLEDEQFITIFGTVRGEKNKKIDARFKEVSMIEPLIFNKQFYVVHEFDAEKTMDPDFLEYVIMVWKIALPLNRILNGK